MRDKTTLFIEESLDAQFLTGHLSLMKVIGDYNFPILHRRKNYG